MFGNRLFRLGGDFIQVPDAQNEEVGLRDFVFQVFLLNLPAGADRVRGGFRRFDHIPHPSPHIDRDRQRGCRRDEVFLENRGVERYVGKNRQELRHRNVGFDRQFFRNGMQAGHVRHFRHGNRACGVGRRVGSEPFVIFRRKGARGRQGGVPCLFESFPLRGVVHRRRTGSAFLRLGGGGVPGGIGIGTDRISGVRNRRRIRDIPLFGGLRDEEVVVVGSIGGRARGDRGHFFNPPCRTGSIGGKGHRFRDDNRRIFFLCRRAVPAQTDLRPERRVLRLRGAAGQAEGEEKGAGNPSGPFSIIFSFSGQVRLSHRESRSFLSLKSLLGMRNPSEFSEYPQSS